MRIYISIKWGMRQSAAIFKPLPHDSSRKIDENDKYVFDKQQQARGMKSIFKKLFAPPSCCFVIVPIFTAGTMTLFYLSLFTHPDFLHFPKQRFALCGFHFFRNFYGHFGGGFLKCAGFERFEFCSCQGDLI